MRRPPAPGRPSLAREVRMNRNTIRWLGFAIPTVALITAVHLQRENSPGEALDGVISGFCFTLPFAATSWLRSRFEGGRSSAQRRPAPLEFAFGLLAGAITWALLWLGWTFPEVQGLRPHAFLVNNVATAVAGLMLPAAGRRLPPDPEGSGDPVTSHTA